MQTEAIALIITACAGGISPISPVSTSYKSSDV